MSLEVGYVVSSLIVTGPERGTYKVWVPKKDGDPTGADSYNGFGVNLGNLGSGDLVTLQSIAENYYPIMPLSSGGHMPFDKESGLVSSTKTTDEFNSSTTQTISNGKVNAVSSYIRPIGDGANYKFAQTYPGLTATYSFGFVSGESVNTRPGTPSGNYFNLSLGTKVVVEDNFIIGQLPQTQNDLLNQFRPSNQS